MKPLRIGRLGLGRQAAFLFFGLVLLSLGAMGAAPVPPPTPTMAPPASSPEANPMLALADSPAAANPAPLALEA